MSNAFDAIVRALPVADVPEEVFKYLAGDKCIDEVPDEIFESIFRKHCNSTEDYKTCTYLDENCTILHSFQDEPAHVAVNHDKSWYKNGRLHRGNDKPAAETYNGDLQFFKHGVAHRDGDDPALIFWNGHLQKWCKFGQLHRDNDQPAVIQRNTIKEWFFRGKRHREIHKPAVIKIINGKQIEEFWHNGKYLICKKQL